MANTLFEGGRAAILTGTVDWVAGKGGAGAIQAALMTYTVPTAGIKAITGVTAATPPVVTATSHGFTNGDVVLISGILPQATCNYNGIFVISAVATNTFQINDYITGTGPGTLGNIVGTGTYSSGGVAINLGPSASGLTWASFSGALIGTPVALTAPTEAGGIAGAAGVTFTAVSGAVVSAVALVATASSVSGTLTGTDIMVAWIDGQQIVTTAGEVSTATTLPVERLAAGIPTATAIPLEDGTVATMTSLAAQFARTLTVSSYTNAASGVGSRGTAPATGSGLPVTPNGGNISITWDTIGSGHVGIFKL